MAATCVTDGCNNPPLSITRPDIVDPNGNRARLGNCEAHELEVLRRRVAAATFYESQILAARERKDTPA